jgi:RNA polymerase sigma-70 factor (ECF subfamily)
VNSAEQRRDRFEAAVGEVHDPLQRYLLRRARPHDAEDALSEVLLTLWRRLDDVPGDLVLPWCYGVARRTLANQRRSHQRRLRLVERLMAEPPGPPRLDPTGVDGDPELAAALAELPPADREVLTLWAWEGLEPREMAIVLETTANAASLRLSRARKKLASKLGRQDDGPDGHTGIGRTGEHRP